MRDYQGGGAISKKRLNWGLGILMIGHGDALETIQMETPEESSYVREAKPPMIRRRRKFQYWYVLYCVISLSLKLFPLYVLNKGY